jgi:glycosyltransferase involved in cell wall biosynthesis
MIKFIIISPARNEEAFIERTIKSVINQTIKPVEWIIVNDGSTDLTKLIIEKYTLQYPWIKLVNVEDRGFYYPGTGVVNVIKKGFEQIVSDDWDFIIKLDCDITIESDYLENVLAEFDKNPKLGIASGAIYLLDGNKEKKEKSQSDHPWGASKVYRKQCFADINGWKAIPGWDLADLLAAQMKGWETQCFDEYKIYHFRGTGTRRPGFTKGRFLLGRFHYRYGYSLDYTFLKSIYWLGEKPYIIGGISIFLGYLYAAVRMETKLFDKEMSQFLRKKHRKYLKQKTKAIFNIDK